MSSMHLLLNIAMALVLGVVFVAAGTVVVMAWPRRVQLATNTLARSTGPASVVGILTAILLPLILSVVSVVLAITVIGAILVPVVWLAFMLFWFYGAVTLGLWIGQRVAESGRFPAARQSLLMTAVLGLSILALVSGLLSAIIPWLGGFIAYMLGFIGGGAAILSRLGANPSLNSVSRMIATEAGRVTRRLSGHPPEMGGNDEARRAS